jgi:uncharacterized protein YbjT (DUF2867 family)
MTLVVGATGNLGGQVCRLLRQAGKSASALVRATSDATKVDELRAARVEIVEGDLKSPETLKEACSNVKSLVSTASSTMSRQEDDSIETVDHRGQLNLVEAAKEAGVKQFIFVSFRNDPGIQYPLSDAKRAVERALQESGMTYTSIWAPPFMEAWLSPGLGFDYVEGKIRVFGTGEQRISWISVVNVAEFCVAALDNPAASNRVLDIGGPEALSPLEVVALFEELTGKRFQVEKVPEQVLLDQKAAATNSLEETFAGLMLQCAREWDVDMAGILRDFPIKLASVRDYARQVLSA